MTKILTCNIPSAPSSYTIEIGEGSLWSPHLPNRIRTWAAKFAIISDNTVAPLVGEKLLAFLQDQGLEVFLYSFPAGEQSKTRQTKEMLENRMLEQGLGRDSCLIALGGGVTLDLGGYIAATYCRGIPLIMIPTSLLAMVDASIGGKNGVNTPFGKNLIGCVKQPELVLIDPAILRTLLHGELRNGIVEMIKHGCIADASHVDYLSRHAKEFMALNGPVVESAVFESCGIKQKIIEQDPYENGKRRLLNFGHTIGHALELLSNFALPHGEAVAIGMMTEGYMAMELGYFDQTMLTSMHNALLQFSIPFQLYSRFSPEQIFNAMILDKKSVKGKPRFVLLKEIGHPLPFELSYCSQVDDHILNKALLWMNETLCHQK